MLLFMMLRREFGAGVSLVVVVIWERNFRRLRGFGDWEEDADMGSFGECTEAAKGCGRVGRPLARRESD
jgi:hypothetical protein